jgi:hypothetical protein
MLFHYIPTGGAAHMFAVYAWTQTHFHFHFLFDMLIRLR